jgi:hypothetical protein
MVNFKIPARWIPLAGAASLALAITGCGGNSTQVTNFSEATFQNGLALNWQMATMWCWLELITTTA